MNDTIEPSDEWLTVSDYAKGTGVSIRTVKRHIENGAVETKKDGARRLVRGSKEGHSRDTKDTEAGTQGTQEANTDTATPAVSLSRSESRTQQRDTAGTQPAPVVSLANVAPTEREVELKEEVRFLRGLVEAHARSEAELRAALREALKLGAKQLPEATTPTPTATVPEAATAPPTAPNEQQGATLQSGPQMATAPPHRAWWQRWFAKDEAK